MDNEEHPYALPDSTTLSIRLLCGQDFPDAVPFHVTELAPDWSMDTGKILLRTLLTQQASKTARTSRHSTPTVMANFLDAESGPDFIDISSTSEDTDRPMVQAAPGNVAAVAPAPPQPNMVGHSERRGCTCSHRHCGSSPRILRYMLLLPQVQLDPSLDNALIIERINALLSVRTDPSDLRTCAFGKEFHPWGAIFLATGPIPHRSSLPIVLTVTAEILRAMWDVTCSCFDRLNGPQRVRVLGRLANRHSGVALRRDWDLLTAVLHGDDTAQAANDSCAQWPGVAPSRVRLLLVVAVAGAV